MPMTATVSISAASTMQQVLDAFPGARRALFKKYHLGGCSSCGFSLDETLGQLCARSNGLNVTEVIASIQASHEQDQALLIAPAELAAALRSEKPPRVLDIRSREEWEAARIAGSELFTEELMNQILGRWPKDTFFILVDHVGKTVLDGAAYFLGHGYTNVRALRGGVDAWSQEVDASVPRYQLE
jgi:rhodanese-related sulfurtransferase